MRRQLLLKFFEEINIFFILILFYVKQGRALIKIFKRYQYIFLNKLLFVFDKNSPSRAVRRQLCDGSCATAAVQRHLHIYFKQKF